MICSVYEGNIKIFHAVSCWGCMHTKLAYVAYSPPDNWYSNMLENSKKKIIRLNLLLKQLLVDIIFLVGHDHGDLCGNTNYVRLNTVYFTDE